MASYLSERLDDSEKAMYGTLMETRYDDQDGNFPVDLTVLMRLLVSETIDYIPVTQQGDLPHERAPRGGQNKISYFLTVDAARIFAATTRTPEGRQVATFLVKILNAVQDLHIIELLFQQQLQHHEILLRMHPRNHRVVYFGDAGIHNGVRYKKVGHTDDLPKRIYGLRRVFGYFVLLHVEVCDNNMNVEREFFRHQMVRPRNPRDVVINGEHKVELLTLDEELTEAKCIDLIKRLRNKFGGASEVQRWDYEVRMQELYIEQLRLEVERESNENVERDSGQTDVFLGT
jgi:hypothetical protein